MKKKTMEEKDLLGTVRRTEKKYGKNNRRTAVERLAVLDIMGAQLSASLKPLGTSQHTTVLRGLREALNCASMMLRYARLSDNGSNLSPVSDSVNRSEDFVECDLILCTIT